MNLSDRFLCCCCLTTATDPLPKVYFKVADFGFYAMYVHKWGPKKKLVVGVICSLLLFC